MRFLVALLCGILASVQIAFVFLSDKDGVIDRSPFPVWMQELLPEPTAVPKTIASPTLEPQTDSLPIQSNPSEKPGTVTPEELFVDDEANELIPAMVVSMVEAKAKASAIRIVDDLGQTVGSGVVIRIGKGYFDALTASHVISGMPRFWVEAMRSENSAGVLSIYRSSDASVLSEDRDSDLAHIRVLSPFSPAASIQLPDDLSSFNHSEAGVAWTVDFTGGELPTVDEVKKPVRRPAKRSSSARSVTYWQLTTASKPGMSGSALFDREAKLMGIASGNGDGVAFYSADSEVRRFLDPVLRSVPATSP